MGQCFEFKFNLGVLLNPFDTQDVNKFTIVWQRCLEWFEAACLERSSSMNRLKYRDTCSLQSAYRIR